MSLVSSMNIAQQALAVSQAAITVVSNNIANVDTEGYSKLRVNQASVANYTPAAGNYLSVAESCSGVTIESISRYSDSYLQNYYWQESSSYTYLEQYASVASNVEDMINELDDAGLSDALDSFYSAVTALNNSPTDITVRENYVTAANNLCTVFNSTAGGLNDLRESLVGTGFPDGSLTSSEMTSQIDEVNSLLDQIAEVNYGIIKTATGDSASSALLDQRDNLVTKLSALIPASVKENSNGTMNVSIGDSDLIKGTTVIGYLKASATSDFDNPVRLSIVDKNDQELVNNINSSVDSGSIGAILDICGSDDTKFTIAGVLGNLDKMAEEFADIMNTIQTGDPDGDGSVAMCLDSTGTSLVATDPTDVIFTTNDGEATINASNICVSQDIIDEPFGIAAARVPASAVGNTSNIGNNSNSTMILETREKPYPELRNTTIEGFLANFVSEAGTDIADINTSLKNQSLVLEEVSTNLSSATGVNLDEELTDLIKYQRAYQAAARVFSVCSDLMQDLINLGK